MDEVETVSSNKDSVDVTSREHGLGEDFECGDEMRRCVFKHFVEVMDLLGDSKVGCARKTLQSGHIYLRALTPESFCNPTDYEKQQVRRGKEMSLWCVSGPPLCGVILLDQMDSDQNLYTNFTIVFGALAFKLHEHNIAIEVFKLAMNSNGTDCEVDLEFSVVVAKANIGCVYLILRQLEKAKENLECALKILERFKREKRIVTLEVDIFAVENNLSLVLQGQQNFPAAIKLQNDLVCKAKQLKPPFRMVAAMHYNRAELSLELEDPVKALKELEQLKSFSEVLDDETGIPEEFISSKICLVYLLMKEVTLAEEIAVKLSLSPWLSFFLPSISPPWLHLSSLLPSSSLSSSPLSASSSSISSSSSSSSSSPPSSPPSSTSSSSSFEFEVLPQSNRNLPWDFSVATFANLVDFHLFQENLQPVSMVLDLCVSNCKEMFGKSHPTIASLLYRQGVKFSLSGENVSSKNCFEEALSIYTRSGFALSHPGVSKCNAALARVLLCESFQEEITLSSQSIERTQYDSDEHRIKSKEFIFSDSIASSSMFEKFVKQIIRSEEKFGEISELVMTKNLLKIQGPSVGMITVCLHDRSMKITTQPTHGKKSLVANHEESLPCNCVDIDEGLVEEMKMCASSLGLVFETCSERPSCPSAIQIPGLPLMNPKQTPNVKAMIGASHDGQDSFDDEECAFSARFSSRDSAAKVSKSPNASLLPRTTPDQKSIPGEKFHFPSYDQKNEDEISAVITHSCSFSKVDENKGNEDSVLLPIKDFSHYRDNVIHTSDDSKNTEEQHTKAKPKRNLASYQRRHESRCSPVTLKADNGQTTKNREKQVVGTHEDPSVKPCVIDDRLENVADDVTDGVAAFQVSSSEGITLEQDPNEELDRKLHTPNQKSHGNGKVVKIERSAKQDGKKENNANNSFYRGEVVAADNGDANHAVEVRGACGYQNNRHLQDADIPKEGDSERGSKKKCKVRLGLKGGRRDDFPFNHSSLGAAKIPCTSETSQLGIKPGFLAHHSNGSSMSCSMDETEERINCTNICQFSDCGECSSSDTATASITALTSPDQTGFFNFNGCQPEKSFSLPYKSKYRSPKNQEILSPPPQFPSLPCDFPQERHYSSENYFDIGAVQSRSRHSIDSDTSLFAQESSNSSIENDTGLGGQTTGINQREIGRSPFSVHTTSTTPNLISEQAETSLASERFMSQQERKEKKATGKKATSTARVSTDGESTTVQPSLPNSNSGTDSLTTLEQRVAEACSLVERVLKEREEKDKVVKESRERVQRKELSRGDLQQQERSEREARETMQRNANEEATSTGSEEEAPSEQTASPENSQWLCEHYQRLCRVKFPCCGRFYPCHRCHNNSEECEKDNCKANEAFYMECSVCSHQQAINQDSHTCAECMTRMSKYFCSICKHFTGADKNPYHCTKCGICRIHKDKSFHCDMCNVCLDKRLQGKHNCRPDSGHDECCICLESKWKCPCCRDVAISQFNSLQSYLHGVRVNDAFSGCQILPCSHKVHRECAIAMIQHGIRCCPVCQHPLYGQQTPSNKA